MKSSFCIDLQRFMLIPTKFPLSHNSVVALNLVAPNQSVEHIFKNQTLDINKKKLQDIPEASL